MAIVSSSDPDPAAPFFLPGFAVSGEEREYHRLQVCAQRETGLKPTARRIRRLTCRVAGRDCAIEVGQPDPLDGTAVLAILDLGRHAPFGVFTTGDAEAPALLPDKTVYSVTDFA